ncbi:MAG: Inosine-5'-monophosphate dehydrogenase [Candidatus Gottesmanbacteria bacterium GW2011_GWB1_49_7]|uniref:Inosine-5'-monophosphate dehydrogenase n=1 Tax=Candidatus Gottesmanbacteria bacterium GW2011_GWB1_49_7 TaxID=1618448 RepID=A0A0G1W2L0_9BACT|nr:MAG: Inosine-5'-monophosphate dehydrogenase [Candidatus Gottesmanbacteria bacterium GW2011_GWB1_49_7]
MKNFTRFELERTHGLTYDDVLLCPAYAEFTPNEADTGTTIGSIRLSIPILSSAMDTVTDEAMLREMWKCGGLGVLHKNMSIEKQCTTIKESREEWGTRTAAAIGVSLPNRFRARALVEARTDAIVIDSAHGNSKNVVSMVEYVRGLDADITIIAGNVTDANGTYRLYKAGANVVKVGIGGGSICTTRVVSGAGVPQLQAISDCATVCDSEDGLSIIADGGIRYSGDITKAIAAGAHAVMIGNILAGCDEAPGERVIGINDGKYYKKYRGMGSVGAMESGSSDRYSQDGVAQDKLVPEGVEGLVPYTGPVSQVLFQLVGGLKSGMGYVGAKTINRLRGGMRFTTVTQAGRSESHVHDMLSVTPTTNYKG